ncbi:MAG: LLM class flavin-dependent oxidoreductase [Chloroflexota bacterium]
MKSTATVRAKVRGFRGWLAPAGGARVSYDGAMRGIGLSENIRLADQVPMVRRAAELGYDSAWCNETRTRDGFMTCQAWQAAAPFLYTGIGVVPALQRPPLAAAMQAATLAEVSEGRFILGLGSGSMALYRQAFGIPARSALRLMHDYVLSLRGLLAGRKVEIVSEGFELHGVRLDIQPASPPIPLYMAAMGPRMIELAGQIADGILVNWSTAAAARQARERVRGAAAQAGRQPEEVRISGYVRVSVDDDREVARAAVAAQAFRYASIPAYRQHFEAMGFKETVDRLANQPAQERFSGIDEQVLDAIAVYGTEAEVRSRLPEALAPYDHPIVRVVPARPGPDSILAVIEAAAPAGA